MGTAVQEHVQRTREYLLKSAVAEDCKDWLGVLLDKAGETANGTVDKMAALSELTSLNTVAFVRHVVRTESNDVDARGRSALALGLKILHPWRWPIAVFLSVSVFSPNFAAVLDAARRMLPGG